MEIVNLYYELARQHTKINGFMYDRAYNKGAGNDMYPLVWLDDPVAASSANAGGSVLRWSTNIDFLGIPLTVAEVTTVQGAAIDAGLSFIEQIGKVRATTGIGVDSFNFLTLRDYYDDKAAGARFTIYLTQANPINRCAENFDPTKQFPTVRALPDFTTENPTGCAIFNNGPGLPNFKTT